MYNAWIYISSNFTLSVQWYYNDTFLHSYTLYQQKQKDLTTHPLDLYASFEHNIQMHVPVNIHDISIKLFIVVTCPFLVRLNPIVESTHNIFWLSVILSNELLCRVTGKPFHNFITWQDLRSRDIVKGWNNSFRMKVRAWGKSHTPEKIASLFVEYHHL